MPQTSPIKYIYQLPRSRRIELCRIFDQDKKWRELAANMNYDDTAIEKLKKQNSQSDELLKLWGYPDRTILELFVLLLKMKYYPAMLILEPFIPVEYRSLINKGDQSSDQGTSSWDSTPESSDKSCRNQPEIKIEDEGFSDGNQIDEARAAREENCANKMEEIDKLNLAGPLHRVPAKELLNDKSQKINRKMNVETHNERKGKPLNPSWFKFKFSASKKQKNKKEPKPQLKPPEIENDVAQNKAPNVSIYQSSGGMLPNNGIKFKKRLNLDLPKQSETEKTGLSVDLVESPISPTVYLTEKLEVHSISESVAVVQTSLEEIEKATNGWNPKLKLGEGAFGEVYKGIWRNTEVAIKRSIDHGIEFIREEHIQSILKELKELNRYRHDNILPVYGFSIGEWDVCLIYQYMVNGSLEDRLISRKKEPLAWSQRLKIAIGTARGLQFLHNPKRTLVHGDIKSGNILLDANFEPKIGDFGLAREGPYKHYTCKKISRIRGTKSYLPPEYLISREFSSKTDIYSFGIVLFELATGRWAFVPARHHNLRDLIKTLNLDELKTVADKEAGSDEDQTFLKLIELGKRCTDKNPKERPEMVLVLEELQKKELKNEIQSESLTNLFKLDQEDVEQGFIALALKSDQEDAKQKESIVPILPSNLIHFSDSPINDFPIPDPPNFNFTNDFVTPKI